MRCETGFSARGMVLLAEKESGMNSDLKAFVVQWLGVVAMALIPVILTAFVGMPLTLGGHPGESFVRAEPVEGHMT
jgi:hypothetical protein